MGHFDVNKSVALAHVRAEQMKGWFLANAKLLLVLLSGSMMFLGVVSLFWGNQQFTSWWQLVPLIPVAVVAGLLAICIEGGTIFASAFHKEIDRKVRQEIEVLDRVKTKIGSDQYAERKAKIENQKHVPLVLMIICMVFSVTGAEIFWQRIFASSEWYFHIIGAILGIVCSALLMIFELNQALVERVIERCISSSSLVHLALQESARSQIHNQLFEQQEAHLASPEFKAIIGKGAEQGLLGVVVESVNTMGMSVSANQLHTMIKEEAEVREAAETYIATGGKDPALLAPPEKKPVQLDKKRVSKHHKAVEELCHKYGVSRVAADVSTYASELGMDPRTFKKHLQEIANRAS